VKIDFEKLSLAQNTNFKKALEAYENKVAVSSDSPAVLYIELTRNCIARCAFCRGAKWVNNPAYDMKSEIFDILLRDYIPYAVLVDLRSKGESLMLSNFDKYVEDVAKYGPKIRLTTTLGCGTKKALQSIIDYDVFLSVSFDAADKRLYESIRPGVNYDTVIQNLEFVIKGMKEKYGTIEDKIRLSVCPFQKKNLNAVEGIFELADTYGISEIAFGPLLSYLYDVNSLANNKYDTYRVFKKITKLAKKNQINVQLVLSPFGESTNRDIAFNTCCHPWMYCQVMYDGDVIFCDHLVGDSHKKRVLGNVRDSKDSVWNGSVAQKFRKCHFTRPHNELMEPCNDCYKKGRYSDHEHELSDSFSRWLFDEKKFDKTTKILREKKVLLILSDVKNYVKCILSKVKHGSKVLSILSDVKNYVKCILSKVKHGGKDLLKKIFYV